MQEESVACSPAGKMRLARQPVLHKPGQHIGNSYSYLYTNQTGKYDAVQREGRSDAAQWRRLEGKEGAPQYLRRGWYQGTAKVRRTRTRYQPASCCKGCSVGQAKVSRAR